MTKNIISQKSFKSQDLNNIDELIITSGVDINFVKLSVWATIPKRGTIFVPSRTIYLQPELLEDGNLVERKIEISPSAEYGYPTVQTQEYWFILQHLWHEQGRPYDGRVYFSRRQIIEEILGKKNGSNSRKALELSLLQLAYTGFGFDYVFYDKAKDITHSQIRHFHLITDLYLTEKKEKNKIIHDKCFVVLHPLIVSNLQNNYCKPIILSVITEIKSDIGKLLYTKLDTHFSYYNKLEISTERFFREHGLEGKEYKYPSTRKRLLEKAVIELIGKPTSSGAHIKHYEFLRTVKGKDWKLLVYSDGKNKKKKKEVIEVAPIQNVVSEQEETHNVSSVKTKQVTHKKKTTQKINGNVLKVIAHFKEVFGVPYYRPNKNAITIVENLLKNHSLQEVKRWIYDASQHCRVTGYDVQSINGIEYYIEPYFKELEASKRRQEQERKQRLQEYEKTKRLEHENKYTQDYKEYIFKRLKIISKISPDNYLRFLEAQEVEIAEVEEKKRNASNESTRKIYMRLIEHLQGEVNQIQKAVQLFKNTEDELPDFWEWDNTLNSNKFQIR